MGEGDVRYLKVNKLDILCLYVQTVLMVSMYIDLETVEIHSGVAFSTVCFII
jgi:hypothetical protein